MTPGERMRITSGSKVSGAIFTELLILMEILLIFGSQKIEIRNLLRDSSKKL
jgi:hypothetical protein